MIVGTEWLIEAFDCEAEKLRDVSALQTVFSHIVGDLNLKILGEPNWHKFGGAGGVTGLTMLTESHLACHTYPEHQTATFNLYCCKNRPEWNWDAKLKEILGAKTVEITKIERGSQTGNAVVSTAVTDASRFRSNFPKFSFDEIKVHQRGYLPHWEKQNGIYFVTFRLKDSLPKGVIEALIFERESAEKNLAKLERELKPAEKRRIEMLFSDKLNEYLDAGHGECHLRKPEIAKMIENSLKHFDGAKYRLFAWCIMPNHVHILFQVLGSRSLSEITHSWKSYTAHEANKILGLSGNFWQRESFDHVVRDEKSFYKIAKYIVDNPLDANLSDWRWVGMANVSEKRFEAFIP